MMNSVPHSGFVSLAAMALHSLVLLASASVAAGQQPGADEEGFESIFDGRTLTGWDGVPGCWSAENDMLVGRTTAEQPLKQNTFLVWNAGWVGDFELRFSYRILSGNSGVQYRSELHPGWRVTGYQADLEDGPNYTGHIYEEGGRGIMAPRGEVVRRTERGSSEVEDRFAKPEFLQAQIKPRDWNQYVIRAEGEVLTHIVNGVMIARLIDEQSTHAKREGILALQLHAGPPMEVHFKHLRLKHLKRSAAAPDPNQATPAEAIEVPPGFSIERLYSVPRDQGSWVSLVVDPRGRLIASDQYGALYRISGLAQGETLKVEKLDIEIGEAQGMLFVGSDFYVCVNGRAASGSGVYRLRDKDNDDRYEEIVLLKQLAGDGEHGPHALALGPDGWIYVLAGNHTKIPDEIAKSSPHRNYAEDQLLPRNPDGRGHATGVMAPGGWIARFKPDGGEWELFAAGMRNAYDFAFSPDGEIFAFDSDMEWDIGTPWYRPTRVVHLQSAAEFGWRYGTGKWPSTWPDSLPAVVDIGEGSPTGVVFGTKARFPRRYREALFVADWTFGRVHAVWPKPVGSSYVGTSEIFLSGRPLAVTDMVIGNDGHLYFAIGGRRVQSGLYRVKAFVPDFEPIAAATEGAEARAQRRALEVHHGCFDAEALDDAWPALDSADRSLRWAARVILESRDPASWRERALAEVRPRARLECALALARCGRAEDQAPLLKFLAAIDFKTLDEEALAAWLRIHALAFVRLAPPTEEQRNELARRIAPLFPRSSYTVDRDLSAMLVYLQHPSAVAKTLELVAQAPSQEEQLHYIFVLRNAARGWNLPLRTTYFSWLNFAPQRYRGGMSFEAFLQQIKKDAIATLSAEEKTALSDVLAPPPPLANSTEPVRVRKFVKNWRVADLLPRLEEVSRDRSFESGRNAFVDLQCLACHRFGERGGATGPALSNIGGRFSRRDVLDALLEPSKVISDQYQNEMLITSWDEVFIGRVIGEDATTLELKTHPLSTTSERLSKADIAERRASEISPMPNGLLDVLSAEEVLDLLAYMETGGDPKAPAFKR